MAFEIKLNKKNDKSLLELLGQIDEEAQFPTIANLTKEVYVDLAKVGAINSVGIRSWIHWFSSMPHHEFQFIHCPKALVMQMNMVDGFLPSHSRVISMEVPFYCEKCDKETTVYFEVGKHLLIENGRIKMNYSKASICKPDCTPELDVNEIKFFRFLTKATSKAA